MRPIDSRWSWGYPSSQPFCRTPGYRCGFFITSQHLQTIFRSPSIRPLVHIFSLHNFDAKADIRLFLRRRFAQIYAMHQRVMPNMWCPTYAAGNSVDDRTQEQLDVILGIRKAIHANLDRLYTRTLLPAESCDDSIRSVVGTITLLFDTLPLEAIEDPLQIKHRSALDTSNGLHGFLDIPYPAGDGVENMSHKSVRIMHSEFREFFANRERFKGFSIDPVYCHGDMAHFCLQIMMKLLRENYV